jgi:RNA polymerase sigma-70 factor (ECF subfamily)
MIPRLQDREELAQDVFIKVYFKLDKFRFESKFSTWLYTVTYRTALSYLRKAQIEWEEIDDQNEPVESAAPPDPALYEALEREVAQLGLEDRTVISLYHQQGCTVDEIARIVEKPVGTAKNQLFRARKKLKQKLEAVLGEEAV